MWIGISTNGIDDTEISSQNYSQSTRNIKHKKHNPFKNYAGKNYSSFFFLQIMKLEKKKHSESIKDPIIRTETWILLQENSSKY